MIGIRDFVTTTQEKVETDRDSARAALRELVMLSTQCAAKEREIQSANAAAAESADKELARAKSNLEMRIKSLREEIAQKYAARIEQINQQFQKDLGELKENDTGRRRHIADEHD